MVEMIVPARRKRAQRVHWMGERVLLKQQPAIGKNSLVGKGPILDSYLQGSKCVGIAKKMQDVAALSATPGHHKPSWAQKAAILTSGEKILSTGKNPTG